MYTVSYTKRRTFPTIALALLVLLSALLIRLYPVESESFANDAIMSQMAAQKGFTANAMDRGDILSERRGHPPLLAYIIILNNRVFGSGPFSARLFSIIAGSLSCLAVFLAVALLTQGLHRRLIGALFGGWMVCFLPVHLYASRSSNWDAVYSLLALCSLIFVSRYIARGSRTHLVTAGVCAALAFLTCEIGLLLIPAFAVAFYFDIRRNPIGMVVRDWLCLAILVIAIVLFLWPAGILKFDIASTIRFRLYDSAIAKRNLPWFMFYIELYRQAPAFTIMAVFGIVSFLLMPFFQHGSSDRQKHGHASTFRTLLPFAVYIVSAFVVSLKNTLVWVHHITDMLPPLAVLFSVSIVIAAQALYRTGRIILLAACLTALAFSIPPAMTDDPDIVGPQEHPGFLGIADYFEDLPDARIYYYYADLMAYYLPQARFEGTPPRHWTAEKIQHVTETAYDYVVSDWSMVGAEYPDIFTISIALRPRYRLAHTVMHRRTGRPVAWIFSRSHN
ncbi:MAG: glycosyltransferase family 39 protein [bacterium]|nr:MAG: glycosyltransferase family 39 protein [bacterium]